MEFNTYENYCTSFYMLLGGIVIGTSVMAALCGKVGLRASLAISSVLVVSFLTFTDVLSVNIVDDHLVLKTVQLFKKKRILMNIKEVELQLYYVRPRSMGRGKYAMRVIRNNNVLYTLKYDKDKINDFIQEFNQKKSSYLNLKRNMMEIDAPFSGDNI